VKRGLKLNRYCPPVYQVTIDSFSIQCLSGWKNPDTGADLLLNRIYSNYFTATVISSPGCDLSGYRRIEEKLFLIDWSRNQYYC
jgi:hypothetical protein